jgi:hypothetical protein
MRITAIDPIRATDDDGRELHLEPGDTLTVGENFGRLACQLGWASDADGVVETGPRRTGPVRVTPENLISESDA